MNANQPLIIFTTYRTESSTNKNISSLCAVSRYLKDKGIKVTELQGVYKGEVELSIAIPWSGENEEFVKGVCKDYNQETYLVTTSNNAGLLLDPETGVGSYLGKLQVTEEAPKHLDCYSMVLRTGKYFYFG